MAFVTYGTTPAKGATTVVTLDKTVVEGMSQIDADAYWTDSANIKNVFIQYKSTAGGQIKVLMFDFSLASPTASLAFSARARSNFQIFKMIVKDFDDGEIVLNRSDLLGNIPTLADMDISLA